MLACDHVTRDDYDDRAALAAEPTGRGLGTPRSSVDLGSTRSCAPKDLDDCASPPDERVRREASTVTMPDTTPRSYRLNSFFAGIGGFDLAFSDSGFETSFYCEKDRYCRRVLERHWPATPNAADIRSLEVDEIPKADVWTAGFPCQDLSLAKVPHGRHGFRGSHSSLFFTFHDLLSTHKPEVVLLENVTGLLNSHGGADFGALLAALTSLGYAVAWRVLNARHFGVPQSRSRVFICAWMNDPERAVRALYEEKAPPQAKSERTGFITASYCGETGAAVPQTSYCVSATSGRHTGLDWARSYVTYDCGVRRPTPLECERLQGFPDGWSIPMLTPRERADSYDTERYRAVGNAVAIPVVRWIARRIAAGLQSKRSTKHGGNPGQRAATDIADLAAEFRAPQASTSTLEQAAVGKWQRGGITLGDLVTQAPTSTRPLTPVESRMVDIIEKGRVDARYFLSPNAARGIVRRVDRRGRNLFPPLDASLRRLAVRDSLEADATQPCVDTAIAEAVA